MRLNLRLIIVFSKYFYLSSSLFAFFSSSRRLDVISFHDVDNFYSNFIPDFVVCPASVLVPNHGVVSFILFTILSKFYLTDVPLFIYNVLVIYNLLIMPTEVSFTSESPSLVSSPLEPTDPDWRLLEVHPRFSLSPRQSRLLTPY